MFFLFLSFFVCSDSEEHSVETALDRFYFEVAEQVSEADRIIDVDVKTGPFFLRYSTMPARRS